MYRTGEIVVEQCPHHERDPEELRLVRAVVAGDLAAFDLLVDRHARPVTSLIRRFIHNPNEVEDAVQETFIRAFQNLRRFRADASLRTWLFRIAINVCEDHRRSAWRRRVTLAEDVAEVRRPAPPGRGDSFSDAALFQEALAQALRELPDRLRIPFTLHLFEELPGAEIAAVLGVNENTVWSRIYAARKALRKKLAPLEPG